MPGYLVLTEAQRRVRLAERHRLVPGRRTDEVPTIATDLVALHSSDPVTVFLSALARMRSPALEAVDEALYTDRILLRHHAMRRTLWVSAPQVLRGLSATTTGRYAATEHRRVVAMLEANDIGDGEAWLTAARRDVTALLVAEGPMTARAVGQLLPQLAHPLRMAVGKSYEGVQAAHTRVLLQLGFEGAVVRTRPVGSWVSGQYAWAATDDWVPGALDPVEDERAAAQEAARQWLSAFGPGTTADMQWYMGWTTAITRRALADAGAVPVTLAGAPESPGWVAAEDIDVRWPVRGEPWVAVLPGLDPTTMGWKQRAFYLPPSAADAFDRNGNAGPSIWVDGEVVGGWAQARDGELHVVWFRDVPAARRRQVQRRLDEVREWVGPARFSVRFPAPYQRSLLADG